MALNEVESHPYFKEGEVNMWKFTTLQLTWSASPSPAKSDIMFPMPAAAIVEMPRVTPMVVSMYSPWTK